MAAKDRSRAHQIILREFSARPHRPGAETTFLLQPNGDARCARSFPARAQWRPGWEHRQVDAPAIIARARVLTSEPDTPCRWLGRDPVMHSRQPIVSRRERPEWHRRLRRRGAFSAAPNLGMQTKRRREGRCRVPSRMAQLDGGGLELGVGHPAAETTGTAASRRRSAGGARVGIPVSQLVPDDGHCRACAL